MATDDYSRRYITNAELERLEKDVAAFWERQAAPPATKIEVQNDFDGYDSVCDADPFHSAKHYPGRYREPWEEKQLMEEMYESSR